ncbi:hypothetical protein [Dyella telluris]|uniref:Uncharacterized protein n=1 Tax=Dyella telluris TaxID=2763498 RepID=A0A7G8Q4I9_9GAMM|nr:hypothetical protein [Dyella telluris]QNK01697.1 hypothetical protein H8F01_00510 [Dyella telluris]
MNQHFSSNDPNHRIQMAHVKELSTDKLSGESFKYTFHDVKKLWEGHYGGPSGWAQKTAKERDDYLQGLKDCANAVKKIAEMEPDMGHKRSMLACYHGTIWIYAWISHLTVDGQFCDDLLDAVGS